MQNNKKHKNQSNDITYKNIDPFTDHSILDVFKWRFTAERAKWPEWIESKEITLQNERFNGASATFINHSTLLLQIDNINILTDPFFSERASPFTWIGPKRVRNPAISIENLPPIDIILISHNHYDHLDIGSLKKLYKIKNGTLVITGKGNQQLISKAGFHNIVELDWWHSKKFNDINITFTPARHFSARSYNDKYKSLWGSFVIESRHGNYFFSGDTGKSSQDKILAEKYGKFKAAFLPIGAYEPRWFMKDTHMNPEEAVQAHIDINSELSIGIHFGTIQLTDEGIDTPIEELYKAKLKYHIAENSFIVPKFGETFYFNK